MSQLISLHTKYKVLVTAVAADGIFFVQLDTPEAYTLTNLSEQIGRLVQNNPGKGRGFFPSPGKKCFAQFNGEWRRALVLKMDSQTSFTLYYVDYGDVEPNVHLGKILAPISQFFEMSFQAVQCKIANFIPNNGVWSKEVIQTLTDNILLQEVPCLFHGELPDYSSILTDHEIPCYLATLYWEDSDDEYTVAEELVAMGIGTHPEESPDEILSIPKPKSLGIDDLWTSQPVAKPKTKTVNAPNEYQYLSLEVGEEYNVYISYSESPSVVWCQLSEYSQLLETLVLQLQEHMNTIGAKLLVDDPLLEAPLALEQPCCVMYTVDGNWCRGLIQDVDLSVGMAMILFVDFGNAELVPVTEIMCLHPKFFEFPVQALSFSLYGVAPVGEDWSDKAKSRFEELYNDQELICFVEGLDDDGYPSANLQDVTLGTNLARILIEEGHAIDMSNNIGNTSASIKSEESLNDTTESVAAVKPKKLSIPSYIEPNVLIGKEFPVYVTYIESVDNFYCQLLDRSDELMKLMNLIDQHCNSEDATPIYCATPNLPVLAKYSEDNGWYRASLIPPVDNQWSVTFVDYGNSEAISLHNLCTAPDTFLHLPVQTIHCGLINTPQSEQFNGRFIELVLDQEVRCLVNKIVKPAKIGKKYLVQLLLSDNTDVLESLSQSIPVPAPVIKSTDTLPVIPSFSVPINKPTSVVISYIESILHFACQVVDNSEAIESLVSQMNKHYSAMPPTNQLEPREGTYCAALFSQDNMWYRARINSYDKTANQIHVLFVDYGNSESLPVSNIRELTSEFLSLPNQAIACTLEDSQSLLNISRDVNIVFEETCLDGMFQAIFTELSNDGKTSVTCKLFDSATDEDITLFLKSKIQPAQVDNVWADRNRINENILKKSPRKDDTGPNLKTDRAGVPETGYLSSSSSKSSNAEAKLSQKTDYTSAKKYPAKTEPKNTKKDSYTSSHSRSSSTSSSKSEKSTSSSTKKEDKKSRPRVIDLFRPNLTSVMSGKVSCVVSPSEFYVQPSVMSHKFEQLMKNLQTFYAHEKKGSRHLDPQIDGYCACVGPNDLFYRCFVRSYKDNGKFEVFSIDYGFTFDVKLENVFVLSDSFMWLPSQAICCSLNSFFCDSADAIADATDEMKQTVLHKDIEVTFHNRQAAKTYTVDIIVRQKLTELLLSSKKQSTKPPPQSRHTPAADSTHLSVPGLKTSSSGSSRRSSDHFVISPLLLLPGHEERIIVSSVSQTGQIYCQMVSKENELNAITSEIENATKTLKQTNFAVQAGGFVLGQFTVDDTWYRAKILSVLSENEVTVMYIDYGNEEVLPKARLLPLTPALTSCPSLAICCELESLENCTPSEGAVKIIEEKLIDSFCLVQVLRSNPNGEHVVRMINDDSVDIAQWIISEGLFKENSASGHASIDPEVPEIVVPKNKIVDFMELPIKPKESLYMYISYVDEEDDSFWAQKSALSVELEAMSERLSEMYGIITPDLILNKPQVGQPCCAKYSLDNNLYRATVLSIEPNGTNVIFVDYGNQEVVQEIYKLIDEFYALPKLAVHCKMVGGIRIPSNSDNDTVSLMFSRKDGYLWYVHASRPSVVEAQLSSPYHRPLTPLADVSIPSLQIKPEDEFEVFIVHTELPTRFWCQLVKDNQKLEELTALMDDYYMENIKEASLAVDSFCVAQYGEYSNRYRAKILKAVSPEEVEISFVDYGNTTVVTTDKIQALDEAFAHLPAQAIPCSLLSLSSEEFREDQLEAFFSLNVDTESFFVTIKNLLPSGHWYVLLRDQDGKSINDLLPSPSPSPTHVMGTTPTYHSPKYCPDVSVDVFVTCVNSPDSFYCQPLELAVQLEHLVNDVSLYMSQNKSLVGSLSLESLAGGQPCLACYTTDSDWYRGQVVEINWTSNQVLVLYVDYGNLAMLGPEQISPLPPQFLVIPTQSLHCSVISEEYNLQRNRSCPREVQDKLLHILREKESYNIQIVSSISSNNSIKYIVEVSNGNKKLDFSFVNEYLIDTTLSSEQDTSKYDSSVNINDFTNSSSIALKSSKTPTSTDLDESEEDSTAMGEPLIRAPFKLSLSTDAKLMVKVVHVEHPLLLYLQRLDCAPVIEQLSKDVSDYCTSWASQMYQPVYHPGDFVLAQSPMADQRWLRACVLDIVSEGSFNVSFIDYGYRDVVSSKEMVMCTGDLLDVPIQAIPCSLSQVPSRDHWPDEYRDLICELSKDKDLEAHVVMSGSGDLPPVVTLLDKETDVEIAQKIHDLLQEECEAGAAEVLANLKSNVVMLVENEVRDEFEVEIQNDDSVNDAAGSKEIDIVEKEYEDSEPQNDDSFEQKEQSFEEKQEESQNDDSLEQKEQSFEEKQDESQNDDSLEQKEQLFEEKQEESQNDDSLEQKEQLFEEKQDESQNDDSLEQKEQSFEEKQEESQNDDSLEQKEQSFEEKQEESQNDNSLEQKEQLFEEKQEESQDFDEQVKPEPQNGVDNSEQEDGQFKAETTVERNETNISLLVNVDHNEEKMIDDIDDEHIQKYEEKVAIEVDELFDEKNSEERQQRPTNGIMAAQSDSLKVDEVLTPPPISPLCTPSSRTLHVGSRHEVFVVNITSPCDFVCHLTTYHQVLDAVMSMMSQLYETQGENSYSYIDNDPPPAVNDVVCAKYTKDGNYYRARIITVNSDDSTYKIEYIDYGYTEIVGIDRLFKLDSELSINFYPPFALKCSLFGVTEDLDMSLHFVEVLVSVMRESLNSKQPAAIEVMAINEGENSYYYVKLFGDNNVNVNDLVLKKVQHYRDENKLSNKVNNDIDLSNTLNC